MLLNKSKNKTVNNLETLSEKQDDKSEKVYRFMNEVIGIKDVFPFGGAINSNVNSLNVASYIETADAYCVIMTISTPDVEILTEDEVRVFEDNVISYMMSLNFQVKYRTTSKKIKLDDFRKLIDRNKNETNENIIGYRKNLLNKVDEIEHSKDAYLRQSYVCISANRIKSDRERTLRELESRFTTVYNGLTKAGIKLRIINSLEVYQLFFDIFHKNSNLLLSETIDNGTYDLLTQGSGLLYIVDDAPEDSVNASEVKDSESFVDAVIKSTEKIKNDNFFLNGTTNIKNMVKPDIFDVHDDYISMGPQKICRMYSLENLPRYLNLGYLNEFYSLGLVDTSVYIENIPDNTVIKTITKKYSKIKSHIDLKQKEGIPVDYDQVLAVQDLDSLRQQIQTNADRMFYAQTLITIWADNLELLERKCTLFDDICSRKGLLARALIKDQREGFLSSLPLNGQPYKENLRNITCGSGASFLPVGNTELKHKFGTYWGVNGITKSPIVFDNFLGQRRLENSNDLTNPNLFICGKGGSGKSTTLKIVGARKKLADHWLMIIDPEAEYRKMVERLGGKYITIKAGERSGINPFEIEVEEDEDKKIKTIDITGKVAEIRTLISTFAKEYGGSTLRPNELVGLEKAIFNLYKDRGITRDPDSLYIDNPLGMNQKKKKLPILSDLKIELEKSPYTKDLADFMNIITGEGTMAIFDCETDPSMDVANNTLIGFNLKELDEFTQFYAIKNILSWIWGIYSNYKYKKFDKEVIIDESWLFARKKEADLIEHFSRRGRKYMISLTICTQFVEEFLNDPSGKAIIQQCATKFFMRQDPAVAKQIVQQFGLSENSQSLICSFDKGQGLFVTERDQILLNVEMYDFEKEFAET
jgi:hypothetical protein